MAEETEKPNTDPVSEAQFRHNLSNLPTWELVALEYLVKSMAIYPDRTYKLLAAVVCITDDLPDVGPEEMSAIITEMSRARMASEKARIKKLADENPAVAAVVGINLLDL